MKRLRDLALHVLADAGGDRARVVEDVARKRLLRALSGDGGEEGICPR